MYCLYDARKEVLIVKFRAGYGHEYASHQFSTMFTEKLIGLGLQWELTSFGSTKFRDQRRYKKPDDSFKPRSTRPNDDDWPSLVLEVGLSQSLAQLQLDAQFWLTRSQLQTNIVILIHIDMGSKAA